MGKSIEAIYYKWKQIEPLSENDKKIDLGSTGSLYEAWNASRARLEKSSSTSLKEYNERLIRSLSIETGILERLYDLDRGTTEALIAHGFVEDLVSHSNTNIEPARLIDILRDQEAAIKLVLDCIKRKRALTKSLLHELHTILMRHQNTYTAVDSLGVRIELPLSKGKFKGYDNNPTRPDGSLHEYCPPIHVESEIDNLLGWYTSYSKEDPIIVAAWFHHRFTQIHPYQDGNGRISRVLTTLILLSCDLLPLVIDRDQRIEYIHALESADKGDLSKLASMFARLERDAIMRALSVETDVETNKKVSYQKTYTSAVIDSIADKITKKQQQKHNELRTVNNVAKNLQEQAYLQIERDFNALKEQLSKITDTDTHFMYGNPGQKNAYWYRSDVIESAKAAGKFANLLMEDHYFVRALIHTKQGRLVFVTSFHHVGRELSGIMESTAFCQLESIEDSEDRGFISKNFYLCSRDPFVFTYKTKIHEISTSFAKWLDEAVAVAIKEYGDRL